MIRRFAGADRLLVLRVDMVEMHVLMLHDAVANALIPVIRHPDSESAATVTEDTTVTRIEIRIISGVDRIEEAVLVES